MAKIIPLVVNITNGADLADRVNQALSAVETDATITGDGNIGTPLSAAIALSEKPNKNNVLEKDNTKVYHPSADYHPATKKYVDDNVQVNTVLSVAGKAGHITLSSSDVGLSNVNNTSDADKPISNLQQIAFSSKQDALEFDTTPTSNSVSPVTSGGIYNALLSKCDWDDARLSNSRQPTGVAGGVLSGMYPNPTLAIDVVTTSQINGLLLNLRSYTDSVVLNVVEHTHDCIVEFKAMPVSPNIVTIPSHASEAIPIATTILIVNTTQNENALNVVAVAGVTLNGVDGGQFDIPNAYGAVAIYKNGENSWVALNQVVT